jgi:hypothetical protein
LTEVLIALLDLAEAEGRALRGGAARVGLSIALAAVAAGAVLAGIGLCVWGGYHLLAAHMAPWGAALILGAIAVLLGVLLMWLAHRLSR